MALSAVDPPGHLHVWQLGLSGKFQAPPQLYGSPAGAASVRLSLLAPQTAFSASSGQDTMPGGYSRLDMGSTGPRDSSRAGMSVRVLWPLCTGRTPDPLLTLEQPAQLLNPSPTPQPNICLIQMQTALERITTIAVPIK